MQLSNFFSRAALAGLTILGLSTATTSASAARTVTVAAPNGNSPTSSTPTTGPVVTTVP